MSNLELILTIVGGNVLFLYIAVRYLENKIMWRLDRLLRDRDLLEPEERVTYGPKDKAL